MSEGGKGRYIKQIRLAGHKSYFPNKYYSPYDFMDRLNEAVKGRYDLTVIEVRYIVSKSKAIKDMDEHLSLGNFQPERNFNNIFDLQDSFMKDFILRDVVRLVPPCDFDPNKFDEDNQAAKRMEEDRKIEAIDLSLKLLTSSKLKQDMKQPAQSILRFKQELSNALKESEVEIYIKAALTKPVQDLLESEKNSGNGLMISGQGKSFLKIYMHPMKSDHESIDMLQTLCPISDWSLCAMLQGEKLRQESSITYWSVGQVSKQAQAINQSIKAQCSLSLHTNKRGNEDSIEFYAFFFNQIVLKATISLAQIRKIEHYESAGEDEFYMHLSYPPRYFVSILKADIGCDDGFIRNWERVQNFMFLRNEHIMKDEFFRLFLFNNSIFRVSLDENKGFLNFKPAKTVFLKLTQDYKGSIEYVRLERPIAFGNRATRMLTYFKYPTFRDKFKIPFPNFTEDKVWKLKYLILVLIRFNCIGPASVEKILTIIEDAKEDIDIYLYILWQKVVELAMAAPEIKDQQFLPELEREYTQIKQLKISDITRKVSTNTAQISYVFKASLTPSGYLYNPPTPEMKGRLMKEYSDQSEHFMRVTITDDNDGSLKNQKYITKGALKSMMTSIGILNREYVPLGWSPSQLRSYSLWYMHEYSNKTDRLKREQVLSFLGDFSKIDNPAKKAARIGQAFSSSWTYLCKAGEIKEKIIPDDSSCKGYLYTDGIGKISQDLMERISLKLQIRDLTVLQVRYKGAKGILVEDKSLGSSEIHLRPSMIKYGCKHDSAARYLDILDWNKFKAGTLNRQTIILLKSLGIGDKIFEKLQNEHIERISSMSFKDCSIFKHMNEDLHTDINNLEPANITILHMLRAGFQLQSEPFFRGVLETMKKNGYNQLKVKSNILVEKSARIIGIIDEYDILREGELYCVIFDHLNLKAKKHHVEGDVVITRNPCLHPADIRKMRCVGEAEIQRRFEESDHDENAFREFVNCVIFPKKGDIPVTSMISGSDLDGDNFFISWQPSLIPKQDEPIYLIDAPQTGGANGVEKVIENVGYDKMLNFFIEYLNYEKLGQIDNSHLVTADRSDHWAKDADCLELAKIHGKAVDFPKTGFCPEVNPKLLVSSYPDFMQKQQSAEYVSQSVLGTLYHDIKGRIQNLLKDCESQKTGKIDDELIKELAANDAEFDAAEIKEAVLLLLTYERELSGLIKLVGVDTEYEIYSGNFSIAKDKVKNFGKNRLISTILSLRAKYFQEFFQNLSAEQKQKYTDAKESELQNFNLFHPVTRRKAILHYICSYVIKFHADSDFLADENFFALRQKILAEYFGLTLNREGSFCGFVWFVIPKIIINQKYIMRRRQEPVVVQEGERVGEKEERRDYEEEEMI